MALHAAAAVVRPGGWVLVYGANDEGIRPAAGLMGEVFSGIATVAVGGRCRVLRASRGEVVQGLRRDLESWREVTVLEYPGLPRHWVSYPGVFSHGHLDPGTRLLLDVLPPLPPGARVLDYGCGSGIVGAVARARGDGVTVVLLDVDAVALEAARENVPSASLILGDGLGQAGPGPFDAVLSNPPLHVGKVEDPRMLNAFMEEAPALLGRLGILVFVTQRRLPVEASLRCSFRTVSVLGEDRTFRVWEGREPVKVTSPG
jgi:16S rRNA (guanine1207-N2)-methyltransferase